MGDIDEPISREGEGQGRMSREGTAWAAPGHRRFRVNVAGALEEALRVLGRQNIPDLRKGDL